MHFLFTACLVGERLEAHRPPGGELHLKKSFCSLNGVNDWQLSSARDRAWLHPPFTTMFVFCPRHPVFTRSYLSLKVHRVFYFSGRDRISINRCLCRVGGCRPSVMDLWLGGWIFLGERSMAEQFWYFSFFFFASLLLLLVASEEEAYFTAAGHVSPCCYTFIRFSSHIIQLRVDPGIYGVLVVHISVLYCWENTSRPHISLS